MAELSTLLQDIAGILAPEQDHVVSQENVDRACDAFREVLETRFRTSPERSPLRFSNLGKGDRQIWYMANFPEKAEALTPKMLMKFLYGDLLEILVLFLAAEAGHEVTHYQEKVTEDGVHGHLDAVIDGVLIDAKSASSFAFDKFRSGAFMFDDPFGYIPQLSGYHHALLKAGENIDPDRAAFLVADKVQGGLTLAELDKETIQGNPPGPRIAHLKEVIASAIPPERCYSDIPDGKSGNMKLGTNCSYCAFRETCWPGLRTFIYSSGPRFLTKVVREPDVPEAV